MKRIFPRRMILSVFAAIAMLTQNIPAARAANSMTINSLDDFLTFRDKVNSGETVSAVLCTNLDLSTVCGEDIDSWEPIGKKDGDTVHYYLSSFDGGGYTISGLYINSENTSQIYGLFGYCGGASSIKNLTVEGEIIAPYAGGTVGISNGTIKNITSRVNVTGTKMCGGICAYNYVGEITECENFSAVTAQSGSAGGILGEGYCTISRCTNYGNITGQDVGSVGGIAASITQNKNSLSLNANRGKVDAVSAAGGLFGVCAANIDTSYNFGDVSSTGNKVGGIAGQAKASTANCVNYASVGGVDNVGGICGAESGEISSCKNLGEISGKTSSGGIVGSSSGDISSCTNDGSVEGDKYTGGIVGSANNSQTICECVNRGDVTGTSVRVGGIAGDTSGVVCLKSSNSANVRGEGNFTGGIIAVLADGSIENTYNAGEVSGAANAAGVVSYSTGSVKNVFSFTENLSVCAINDGETLQNAFCISGEYPRESFMDGTVLALLNGDSSDWQQGSDYPILKNEAEEGVHTSEELCDAVKNSDTITLAADIVLDETITLERDITVNGGYHTIWSDNEIIKTNGYALKLNNIVFGTDAECAVEAKSSEIELSGLVAAHAENGYGIMQYGGHCDCSAAVTVMLDGENAFLYNTNRCSASEVKVGDYIEAGTMFGEKILWRCVSEDENGKLIYANKIIAVRCFDAAGQHTDNAYLNARGCNLWAISNLRSWLNSDEESVTWLCGNPPTRDMVWQGTDESNPYGYNPYDTDSGFMTGFEDYELDAVKTVKQKCIVNYTVFPQRVTEGDHELTRTTDFASCLDDYDDAYAEVVEDKFFLPDIKQIVDIYNNTDILGSTFMTGTMTDSAEENNEFGASTAQYWVRTPGTDNTDGYQMINVSYTGKAFTLAKSYSGRVGVRPCFYLNPESELSGDGSEDNPYKINDLTENEIKTVSAQKNGNVLNISADIAANSEQFSVIFAVYDENGNVIAVKDILGASGKIDAQIDTGDSEAKTIKTFLWDSANGMKPLCTGNKCTV